MGDHIVAQACRPLSARKRFTLLERLGGADAGEARRARAERMMGAEEKEKVRIESIVKNEVRRRGDMSGVDRQQSATSRAPPSSANSSTVRPS